MTAKEDPINEEDVPVRLHQHPNEGRIRVLDQEEKKQLKENLEKSRVPLMKYVKDKDWETPPD